MAPKTTKKAAALATEAVHELATEPVKIASKKTTKKAVKPDDHIVEDSDVESGASSAEEPVAKKKPAKKAADEEAEEPVTNKKPAKKAAAKKTAKSDEDEKPKTKRKPSEYNIMMGEFMKKISLEESEKPKEERIPPKERMAKAQSMYREWKENRPAPVAAN